MYFPQNTDIIFTSLLTKFYTFGIIVHIIKYEPGAMTKRQIQQVVKEGDPPIRITVMVYKSNPFVISV